MSSSAAQTANFDTIAAIATGSSLAAIGIIRLSGPEAIAVLDRVFVPAHGGSMAGREDRKLVYGRLLDRGGETLDLCLATVSRGPASYTGEDTVELQCHGSPAMLAAALEALFGRLWLEGKTARLEELFAACVEGIDAS